MGRNLEQLPKFVVFNSGIESEWNSPVFHFFLIAIRFVTVFCIYFSELITLGLAMVSWLYFPDELG
jgi:hypothetical protein